MERFERFVPVPAARGVDPLDADATGALARLASDAQVVERAMGNRFSGVALVANFNLALQADAAGASRAWTEFYLALARFVSVASTIVPVPAAPDALAALRRFELILGDDFGQRLLAVSDRRRLKRRLLRLAEPAVTAVS